MTNYQEMKERRFFGLLVKCLRSERLGRLFCMALFCLLLTCVFNLYSAGVVIAAPTANAGSGQTVNVGEVCFIDGTNSTPYVDIYDYKWDFDSSDGVDYKDSIGAFTFHRYTSTGSYTATLWVRDKDGNTDTDTCTITVQNVPGGGTTYYVAKTGDDSNPGTEAQPWLTIGKAAATLTAGDTALVKEGTYNESGITPANSGTTNNPITLKAYPGHNVVISYTSGYGFYLAHRSWITIDGFEINANQSGNSGVNTYTGGSHVVVQNCTIHGCRGGTPKGWGVQFAQIYTMNHTLADKVYHVLYNCSIYDNYDRNVGIRASHCVIEDCEIYDPSGQDNISVSRAGYGTIIRGNSIGRSISNQRSHYDEIEIYGAENVLIENNEIYRSESELIMSDAAVNPSTDTSRGIVFVNNVVWRTYPSNQQALKLRDAPNYKIFNNVFYGRMSAIVQGVNKGSGPATFGQVRNNIFYSTAGTPSNTYTGSVTLSNNCYYGYRSLESNSDSTAYDSFIANPLLVNPPDDCKLQSGSPCIYTGYSIGDDISFAYAQDKDNTDRTQGGGWDIGAYEYMSGGSNQLPAASFKATPTGAPLAVNFTDTSNDPDGTIVEWNWDFGDGGTSTAQSADHTYDNPNTYTVSLKVTDNEGAIDSVSTTISVYSGETVRTYIEAESGSINSPLTTGSVADPPAAGGRYIYAPEGSGDTIDPTSEAVYSINIPHAGDYYFWLRIYGPSSDKDAVYIDIGFNGNFDRVYPSQHEKYEWVRVETVNGSGNFSHTLSAGTNQIVIGHGEELARADMIFVADEPNLTPICPPTGLFIQN